jgi:hypothetical protein
MEPVTIRTWFSARYQIVISDQECVISATWEIVLMETIFIIVATAPLGVVS